MPPRSVHQPSASAIIRYWWVSRTHSHIFFFLHKILPGKLKPVMDHHIFFLPEGISFCHRLSHKNPSEIPVYRGRSLLPCLYLPPDTRFGTSNNFHARSITGSLMASIPQSPFLFPYLSARRSRTESTNSTSSDFFDHLHTADTSIVKDHSAQEAQYEGQERMVSPYFSAQLKALSSSFMQP